LLLLVITIKLVLWRFVVIRRIHNLLFDWKMSKSTKIALTRFGDYGDDVPTPPFRCRESRPYHEEPR